jgi:hypothetical protein
MTAIAEIDATVVAEPAPAPAAGHPDHLLQR